MHGHVTVPPPDPHSPLDEEFQELFNAPLIEVLGLPWQHKRVFTMRQMVLLLRMQLRSCVDHSYEGLVLVQLIGIMEATPTLTREQVKAAYEHIQKTPGLPSMAGEPDVFFALQDCEPAPISWTPPI